ncbi:DUF1833 family protein [Psychrobacter sp. I-STPA6b]|uniref:DUF1833 family protein n=1 Tax=Psychrobacter sp. I-STPA6b TaxID=2585718 RepID=UPI001D0CBFC6|nr:DUF1833 family protein [Psychrobacter sp. I-STPA6b]
MPDYNYWLSGQPDDVRLVCIEVYHPAWSKVYQMVQNHADGITVTHEDGTQHHYEYVPVTTQKGSNSDDLDQEITIAVGDLGEEFPLELDRMRASDASHIKPMLNYREYNLSDLSKPQLTIKNLEVTDYEPKKEGAVFLCRARQMNLTKTGETYNLDDFPTLRGFV